MTEQHWIGRALHDLRHNWGEAYAIECAASDRWSAARLDNGRELLATHPGDLVQLIRADYTAMPVPHAGGITPDT